MVKELINQIKKAIVYIGIVKKGPIGTGFLITIDNIIHLVTAKHVILNKDNIVIYFNQKDGKIVYRPISDIKEKFHVDWVFHQNNNVDIAIIPIGFDLENDDIRTIPDNLFASIDRIYETYDVFYLSYQPEVKTIRKIDPIIRKGSISLINDNKTFLIDGFAFPGNSGSPVFLMPSPFRYYTHGLKFSLDPLEGNFIGIIGQYKVYTDVAISSKTGRPRVRFEENMGLSQVWSVDLLNEMISSEKFRTLLASLKSQQ